MIIRIKRTGPSVIYIGGVTTVTWKNGEASYSFQGDSGELRYKITKIGEDGVTNISLIADSGSLLHEMNEDDMAEPSV